MPSCKQLNLNQGVSFRVFQMCVDQFGEFGSGSLLATPCNETFVHLFVADHGYILVAVAEHAAHMGAAQHNAQYVL